MKSILMGSYDVIVVGAGHAGIEAALACARMGFSTMMLTINLDGIALMACNPAIGGTSKGHLVREVDALGGEMGLAADAASIQQKLLNCSKGPAVRSLRAQEDKKEYQRYMKRVAEHTEKLSVRQGECTDILTRSGKVQGIVLADGSRFNCRALVLATGVYLKGKVIIGDYSAMSGPSGLHGANKLTTSLLRHDMKILRFKTGTPARVDAKTIDFSAMAIQHGMEDAPAFSFMTEQLNCPQLPCYLTYTNQRTHEIIRENLHRSPLFSGVIQGTGPRYCPSIEDKVVRFAEKESHQVFIEPEGRDTAEMYVQGMSTSLPVDVQIRMLRTLPGLEKVQLMRPGYAIEYDLIDSLQLDASLNFKGIEGLYTAGQINGSSGYEEAAAQGILAGINAAQYLKGEPPVILSRTQGYAGVLVDDLVTKGTAEPYRMMTSRAEHRLVLRQDNADLRLTEIGRRIGLVSEARYDKMCRKKEDIEKALQRMKLHTVTPTESLNARLTAAGEQPLIGGIRLNELLKRPGVELDMVDEHLFPDLMKEALQEAQTEIKYEGYIQREMREIERQHRLESMRMPEDLDYAQISGLRKEAIQKLNRIRPANIAQAGRISGVSPADISVLLVYLERNRRLSQQKQETEE